MTERERISDYLSRLYGYALSLCGNPHQAEDLVQECAVRVLSARNVPGDESAYRTWLFKIVRNAFVDQIRRKQVSAAHVRHEKIMVETEFWQGDQRLITVLTVKMELAKLPRPQREIIALIDIAGLRYAEAAALLGIPVGTVMSRVSRARRLLLEAVGSSNVHELPTQSARKGKGSR